MKGRVLLTGIIVILLLFTATSVHAVSSSCQKIGVNFAKYYPDVTGSYYSKAAKFNLGWTLAIASSDRDPSATISGINDALSRGLTPIIRIGVGTDATEFYNPSDYISYLNQVASQANGSFYAIAGPNEPDSEKWLDPNSVKYNSDTSSGQRRAGQLLANYMNAIVDANLDPKVLLLSPTININSWTGDYFITAMIDAGAKFYKLDGFSANAYNTSQVPSLTPQINKIKSHSQTAGLGIFLTEFGDYPNQDINVLKNDISLLRQDPSIKAALIFNAFNTNTGFSQLALSDQELSEALGPDCKIQGDTNNDGYINFLDYLNFISDFSTFNSRSDININGLIDIFDLNAIIKNFGN